MFTWDLPEKERRLYGDDVVRILVQFEGVRVVEPLPVMFITHPAHAIILPEEEENL